MTSSAGEMKHLSLIVSYLISALTAKLYFVMNVSLAGEFSGWGVHNCAPEEVLYILIKLCFLYSSCVSVK